MYMRGRVFGIYMSFTAMAYTNISNILSKIIESSRLLKIERALACRTNQGVVCACIYVYVCMSVNLSVFLNVLGCALYVFYPVRVCQRV